MSVCSDQRCIQERYLLRGVLEKGRKKTPVALGLEEIFQLCMNGFKNSLGEYSRIRKEKHDDWLPEQPCVFCIARSALFVESHERHKLYIESLVQLVTSVNPSTSYGLYNPIRFLPLDCSKIFELPSTGFEGLRSSDPQVEPLDLSMKPKPVSSRMQLYSPAKSKALSPLKSVYRVSPEKVRNCANARRVYSEQSLLSAIADVKSGKLGTRKASIIHGVPRSTIRNHLNRDKDKKLLLESFGGQLAVAKSDKSSLAKRKPQTEDTDCENQDKPSQVYQFNRNLIHGVIDEQFQKVGVGKNPYPVDRESFSLGSWFKDRPNLSSPLRGKRGRYRNYEAETLSQAVADVKQGKLSVTKASTHYNIPISTLEYKVKERQKMRQLKKLAIDKAMTQ